MTSPSGLNAQEVRVGTTGSVLVAPVGTTLPTGAESALPAAWVDLGYLTEDGITLAKSVDSTDITAWQSGVPVRTIITGQTLTVNIPMIQTNNDTIGVYFGIEVGSDGVAHIPADPAPYERALALNWIDGTYRSRFVVPRAQLSDTGDIQIHRGDPVIFNVTFTALAPAGGQDMAIWYRTPVTPAGASAEGDQGVQTAEGEQPAAQGETAQQREPVAANA